MGVDPGTIVFGRNILLHIPVLTGLNLISECRQVVIYYNNFRYNLKIRFKDYHIEDEVLLVTYDPCSLKYISTGNFYIQEVHVNLTITIIQAGGVLELFHIRRILPYMAH